VPDVAHSPSSSETARADDVLGRPARWSCRVVSSRAELAEHLRIRRSVFVTEQGLFTEDDQDVHDAEPDTVHVLGFRSGTPVGTVRLYPLDGGLWRGDRLAVRSEHRQSGIGAPLVRLAVATAGARGGARMHAVVQTANVDFFTALGWRAEGAVHAYLGVPHQTMSIALG